MNITQKYKINEVLPGQYTSLETEFRALQEGVLLARELKLSHASLNLILSLLSKPYKLLILKVV